MEIAKNRLGVPQVLQPEYLASPHLDELSGMTYLSYFMKDSSPGTRATLRWVNRQIPDKKVKNFTVSKLFHFLFFCLNYYYINKLIGFNV